MKLARPLATDLKDASRSARRVPSSSPPSLSSISSGSQHTLLSPPHLVLCVMRTVSTHYGLFSPGGGIIAPPFLFARGARLSLNTASSSDAALLLFNSPGSPRTVTRHLLTRAWPIIRCDLLIATRMTGRHYADRTTTSLGPAESLRATPQARAPGLAPALLTPETSANRHSSTARSSSQPQPPPPPSPPAASPAPTCASAARQTQSRAQAGAPQTRTRGRPLWRAWKGARQCR